MVWKAVKALKMLGLTEYEAKAYTALLELGEAEAAEVSRKAGIPRTRIYDVLSKLESQGLIQGVRGSRPVLYMAVPPARALIPRKEAVVKEVEEAMEALSKIYRERAPRVKRETWLLKDSQAYATTYTLLDETSESTLLRVAVMPEDVLKEIIKRLRRLRKRGVKLYVVIDTSLLPKLVSLDLVLGMAKEFQARAADILFPFNGVVSDFERALLLYTPLTSPETCYGFLIDQLGEIFKPLKQRIELCYDGLPLAEERLLER